MKEFEKLQQVWTAQTGANAKASATDLINKAKIHAMEIKRKHFWTIAILLLTFLILAAYFIWINLYDINLFTVGLGLMMGMLLLRIALEVVSIGRFQKLQLDVSLKDYSQSVNKFYAWRKRIHYVFTPIIYLSYFCGFVLMLPVLKVNLSSGFYTYILISGLAVFIGLAVIIYKQIKEEMGLMAYLKLLHADQ